MRETTIVRSPPSFLALDLAGVCNFRCTTCVLDTRYPDPVLVDWPVLDALKEVLPHLTGIALGCNAEPMMHPRATDIAAWIRERTHARMLVISNASHLDADRGDGLLDAGVDELAVSIDGATAATFEGVRLRSSFAEVVANVDRLARVARARTRPSLTVIFTSMRENLAELPAVLELAAGWGAARLVVNGYEPYLESRADARLWRLPDERSEARATEDVFASVRSRGEELGVAVVLPELVVRAAERCSFVTPVVGPQGAVSPCPALSYDRAVPLRPQPVHYARRVFGQLPAQSFAEIWENPAYVAFREQATCGSFHDDACSRCLVATGVICPRQ